MEYGLTSSTIKRIKLWFKVRKQFFDSAKDLEGNMLVSYTAKTKYVVKASKNIDKIMNK